MEALAPGESTDGMGRAIATHPCKPTRSTAINQNACDACRARKIKCRSDSGETRCAGCIYLDIDCTHHRPRRKRGPPTRSVFGPVAAPEPMAPGTSSFPVVDHANVACSPRSTIGGDPVASPYGSRALSVSTQSPTYSAGRGGGWLSELATPDLIKRLLEDWFARVHSVAPILHRRRFLSRYRRGEADSNPLFCALVLSVCAANVATLRRDNYGSVTVERCLELAERHGLFRLGIIDTETYSLDGCVAKYNFSTASAAVRSLSDATSYRLAADAAAGVRYLAYYRMDSMTAAEQQLTKRLFWLLFAGSTSSDIFGHLSFGPLLTHQENLSHLRPVVLTDRQLDPDAYLPGEELAPWHGDDISYVPGLNALSDLFMVWHDAMTTARCQHDSRSLLSEKLLRIQQIIDDLPPPLRWRGGLSRPSLATEGHDVQIANLFVTSLHLRSNLLQRFGDGGEDTGIAEEHQRIVDDLLEILYHMPRAVFDANGSSLVPKVRDIGAAFLEQQGQSGDRGRGDARGKMEKLLRKLDSLDFGPGMYLPRTEGDWTVAQLHPRP